MNQVGVEAQAQQDDVQNLKDVNEMLTVDRDRLGAEVTRLNERITQEMERSTRFVSVLGWIEFISELGEDADPIKLAYALGRVYGIAEAAQKF